MKVLEFVTMGYCQIWRRCWGLGDEMKFWFSDVPFWDAQISLAVPEMGDRRFLQPILAVPLLNKGGIRWCDDYPSASPVVLFRRRTNTRKPFVAFASVWRGWTYSSFGRNSGHRSHNTPRSSTSFVSEFLYMARSILWKARRPVGLLPMPSKSWVQGGDCPSFSRYFTISWISATWRS